MFILQAVELLKRLSFNKELSDEIAFVSPTFALSSKDKLALIFICVGVYSNYLAWLLLSKVMQSSVLSN